MDNKLYCSKNIIWEWAEGQHGGAASRFCDGPNGKGVEESCIGCNAYKDNEELAIAIGQYVLRKMGTGHSNHL